MEKLLPQVYNFEQVDDNPESFKYDFVSEGIKDIPKRVSFVPYGNGLSQFYNLGLTNITINETTGKEELSDMSRDNNIDDADKVMKTTFVCALDFLDQMQYKGAKVIFQGNTAAKHRYYRMSVNNNFQDLSDACVIKGGYFDNIVLETNPETGEKWATALDIEKLTYVDYNIAESYKYHFITFELKKEDKIKEYSEDANNDIR